MRSPPPRTPRDEDGMPTADLFDDAKRGRLRRMERMRADVLKFKSKLAEVYAKALFVQDGALT